VDNAGLISSFTEPARPTTLGRDCSPGTSLGSSQWHPCAEMQDWLCRTKFRSRGAASAITEPDIHDPIQAIQAWLALLEGRRQVRGDVPLPMRHQPQGVAGTGSCLIGLLFDDGVVVPCTHLPPLGSHAHRLQPIQIYTLGRFEVCNRSQPQRAEIKPQRRPLDLLKALIALGGTDVPITKLIDIVWREPLQGDAQCAFDVTLHRLRKLLGYERAIRVAERRVTLNRDVIWVDVWELEHKLAAVLPVCQARVLTGAELEAVVPSILTLYQGPFLPEESDSSWLLPVRNRLNGRFHRFVMRLGDHWETTAQWQRATELFERAIDLDPMAETFYHRLMVCLREQGSRTEAIEVFRRLRQLLSVTLGVKPGADSQALFRELMES
jgi:DNA-binding SARP family transcriptional activator